ncbi:MAG: DUF4118 domain-containing protein, partial [Leptolyngbya sp. SIO4C5]|nr:DUF4118 domain-containing protein [Leptolyngbya sp. SIO4C5]
MLKPANFYLRNFAIATCSVLIAGLLVYLFNQIAILERPLLLFLAAVVVSSGYGDRAAGWLATVLTLGLIGFYSLYTVPPLFFPSLVSWATCIFAVEGILFSLFIDRLKQQIQRTQRDLRTSQGEYRRFLDL